MVIDRKKFRFDFKHTLRAAGYKFRSVPNDWIKIDVNGRWHITQDEKRYKLHYDLYTEEHSKHHFAPRLPIATRSELKRLYGISRSIHQNELEKFKRE